MLAPSVPRLRNCRKAARTIRCRVCSLCFAGYRIVSPTDYMHHLICLVKETSRLLKALSGFEIYSLIPLVIRVDRRIIATQLILTPSRGALLRVASVALLFDPFQNPRPIGLQSAHPDWELLLSPFRSLLWPRVPVPSGLSTALRSLTHEFPLRSSASSDNNACHPLLRITADPGYVADYTPNDSIRNRTTSRHFIRPPFVWSCCLCAGFRSARC